MRPIRLKILPTAASNVAIAASQSPGTSALTLTALALGPIDPCVAGPYNNLGLGRIISITSGGNDSGIHFTIVGTDHNGLGVTENVVGANVGVAVSTNYYTSVSSITPSAAVASTCSAGTVNTVASAKLNILPLDFYMRTGVVVMVKVSGTISYTVHQIFEDCTGVFNTNVSNNTEFATPASPTALTTLTSSAYTQLYPGVCGISVTIPTYTSTGYIVLNIIGPTNSTSG